jgi:hypothetical protein
LAIRLAEEFSDFHKPGGAKRQGPVVIGRFTAIEIHHEGETTK